ncbi:MAG: hypothetical protein ACPGVD_11410, partial [Flavobacteriales bacterium]
NKINCFIHTFSISLLIFSFLYFMPNGRLNSWSIPNYNSFFIGDIIGVFFILGIFIKGFVSFQTLYRQFSEMINGKSKPGFDEKEGFTEYEIVEDDDPEDIQLIEETE